MLKRFISLLLAAVMLLSLVGCGATASEEVSEETTPTETIVPDSTEVEEDPIAVKIEALLAEGDFEKICTEIVTAEELLRLFFTAGIREGHGDTIEQAFVEKFLRGEVIVELACRILEEDYEEVGIITTSPYYHFFYVMQDDVYSVYDVLSIILSGNIYSESFETKEAMLEYALAKRGDSDGTIKPWQPIVKFKAPNGQTVLGTYNHGIETFSYAGTTIPVGLGLPELSDEEIDTLIAKGDYVATAQAITTLADAVNYIRRTEIVFEAPPITITDPVYGNMRYVASAWQVLKSNVGECVAMSNLLHYFLKEDYAEVGYVNAWTPADDGHTMGYIYHDGLYYLTNPVGYCVGAWERSWLSTYPDKMIACADDFQTIADSLTEYMSFGSGELVNFVHRIKSPGDLAFAMCEYDRYITFYSVGAEVIRYCGNEVVYQETSIDWQSQTRIDR